MMARLEHVKTQKAERCSGFLGSVTAGRLAESARYCSSGAGASRVDAIWAGRSSYEERASPAG